MIVAITGTPGVGKTSACGILKRKGYKVLNLNEIAFEQGLVLGRDDARDTAIIDTQGLNAFVRKLQNDLVFLDGHLSHHLDVDISVVLRCNPNKLRERLASLGWNERKIMENVEAEAIDTILVESLDMGLRTHEIDATEKGPEDVACDVLNIVNGDPSEFHAGNVDWSEVILEWY